MPAGGGAGGGVAQQMAQDTYFRKGFGLKSEISGALTDDYHSQLVDSVHSAGGVLTVGDLTFRLAKEFGFCYGVDRAVEYAYETCKKFPDKKIFLVGEIIHNPHVNQKLVDMGIEILTPDQDAKFDFAAITDQDVVVIPAFGVTVDDFGMLQSIGCVLVDTTCGSVLNVWKRVQQYSRDGYTAVGHGKYRHEETKATASQVRRYEHGHYLVVRDMEEAETVCQFIESGAGADALKAEFSKAASTDFDPERQLVRVGIANQTTMLAGESLAIAHRFKVAMERRYGAEALADHFRTFDTICSATQERQDAVHELIEGPVDAMIVIGGYNSSNTNHLAAICAAKTTTYHIRDAACIDTDTGAISHKPVGATDEVTEEKWLSDSVRNIGITAGASTPNNKIGATVEKILMMKGLTVPT